MKKLTHAQRREILARLKATYDAVLNENHDSFYDQLKGLK